MAEQHLTTTEIDDLLRVFKGGRDGSSLTEVASLDLDRPNRVPKPILEALEIRHEQAARGMRTALRSMVGVDLGVTLKKLDQERFETFRDRQEEPCCGFVFDMRPLRCPAYLVLDFEFAYACIDRLLGGTGSGAGAGRDLTSTEVAVLGEVVDSIVSEHVAAWDRYMKLSPSFRRTVSVPRFMREVRRDDAVLVAEYQLGDFAEGHGFRFAMPLQGLEGLLQYRRDDGFDKDEAPTAPESRAELEEHMVGVNVDVSVRVGEAALSVRDVLALETGDVVLLDRPVEAALDLLVEGRPKLKGRLHRSGRRLVFRLGSGSGVVPEKQDPDA
ncbi:MAG: FliM/FliN family flagellar motor switch protein [Planctomycetes bacterium]|nr:FliM/FliN family flagellar motor switch protein [Planctomycetota bacterium]